jgi:hypothetical protein
MWSHPLFLITARIMVTSRLITQFLKFKYEKPWFSKSVFPKNHQAFLSLTMAVSEANWSVENLPKTFSLQS